MPVLTLDQLEQLRDLERLETPAQVDIIDYEEPIEAGLIDLPMGDIDSEFKILDYDFREIISELDQIKIDYISE